MWSVVLVFLFGFQLINKTLLFFLINRLRQNFCLRFIMLPDTLRTRTSKFLNNPMGLVFRGEFGLTYVFRVSTSNIG
jgi:hypothetical protein